MELRDFLRLNLEHTLLYTPYQIPLLLQELKSNIKIKEYKKRKGAYYLNIPCSFDIETSSWYDKGEKVANMYLWGLSIAGLVVIGRTWEEFIFVFHELQTGLELQNGERHLIIYVQNFSYEFQFMRQWIKWSKVFATDTRQPIDAVCEYGIEVNCS